MRVRARDTKVYIKKGYIKHKLVVVSRRRWDFWCGAPKQIRGAGGNRSGYQKKLKEHEKFMAPHKHNAILTLAAHWRLSSGVLDGAAVALLFVFWV